MNYIIDENVIDEIKESINILDIVSDYVKLERSGSNYVGLCPFHSEKSPSFTVSPDKSFYHCFGCKASGDGINFIMEMENLNFPETIKLLADRLNIKLQTRTKEDQLKNEKRDRGYEINREAALFFLNNLENNTFTQNYLEKRGIDKKLSRQFGLGYALDSWDGLKNHFLEKGYEEKELEELGLLGFSEKNQSYYDRFRNRLIFPIIDNRARVLGFGGRVMDESMPKYLNSKETITFHKSNILYGLNMVDKFSDKKNIILVEGYMDVIALFNNGIYSSVASLGTALTERQGQLLSRYGKDIYICYDTDTAGKKATDSAVNLLLSQDIIPRIIFLEDYSDPDEFFKENTKTDFIKKIDESLHFIDFKIMLAKEKYDLNLLEGKINFTKEIAKSLGLLNNPVEIDVYVNKLAEELNISKEAINSEININKKNKNKDHNYKKPEIKREEISQVKGYQMAELELLRLFILDKKYFKYAKENAYFEYIKADELKKILQEITDYYSFEEFIDKKGLADNLLNKVNIQSDIVNTLVKKGIKPITQDVEKYMADLIETIDLHRLVLRREDINKQIKNIDNGNIDKINDLKDLLEELTEINKMIQKRR